MPQAPLPTEGSNYTSQHVNEKSLITFTSE